MSLFNRLWNTLWPSRLDSDLAREMETHLAEMQEDAEKDGLTPEEAVRSARLGSGIRLCIERPPGSATC